MKKIGVEVKWAVFFILAQLLWMVLERITGLHDRNIEYHYIVTNFYAVVAIAIYVFALLDKRKRDFGGKMSWIQGFISGLILTLGITILTPLSQYLTSAVITPHYFENMIAYMTETGKMTKEEAEANFNMQTYILQSSIFAPTVGLFTSAIVAVFTRKK